MTSLLSEAAAILDGFVTGQPFWPFYRTFMDFHESLAARVDVLPAEERVLDEVYDLVYMGAPDPVDATVVGESQLRERLRAEAARLRYYDRVGGGDDDSWPPGVDPDSYFAR
jgi:hypothetical protein